MVITHHADSTSALFDLTKRYHEHCPEILRPHTKYSSRRELSFDVLSSSFVVATAGGDSVGRGETLTHLHASELAFWPKSTAADIWNGLLQAVPNTPAQPYSSKARRTASQAYFYDLWRGAVAGENGFVPVFIPWFTDPDLPRDSTGANFERTPDEEELAEKYGLDDEQLMFRRRKIAQNGLDLFQRQEYPAEPEEAFLNRSPSLQPRTTHQVCLDEAKDVKERLALEGDEWINNRRGELTTYFNHDPGGRMSLGPILLWASQTGDYSVAQVLDSKRNDKSQLGEDDVHPDYFAEILYALGDLLQRGDDHRGKQLARHPDLYPAYQGHGLSELLHRRPGRQDHRA